MVPTETFFLHSELFLGVDSQLGLERGKFIHVLLVERVRSSLELQALKDADGGGVVIHTSGSPKGCGNDRRRRDEIVSESIVQSTLELKDIIDIVKERDETLSEVFKAFLGVL